MIRPVPDPPGRLVLLTTSSRVPAGLLSAEAWDLVRAGRVFAASAHPQVEALAAAGVKVTAVDELDVERLIEHAADATEANVVWLVEPDGDPALSVALAEVVAARRDAARPVPRVDTVAGAHEPPGARLLELVAVTDRLRSPGGCPWDAEQTHESLATYLLEETYETLEAIETGDSTHLREELGDLLFQVVFHARIAQERAEDPWSVDDVAAGLVDKLVRRHPHVFGSDGNRPSADLVAQNWEVMKRSEKQRTSVLEGVPIALPALSFAAKMLHRAERGGVDVPVPEVGLPDVVDTDEVGEVLLALVMAAGRIGVDPEHALRLTTRRVAERIRVSEGTPPADAVPEPPAGSGNLKAGEPRWTTQTEKPSAESPGQVPGAVPAASDLEGEEQA